MTLIERNSAHRDTNDQIKQALRDTLSQLNRIHDLIYLEDGSTATIASRFEAANKSVKSLSDAVYFHSQSLTDELQELSKAEKS